MRLREQGIDARALADANEQMRKVRNSIAHGTAFGPEQVRQLKRDWLGQNLRRKRDLWRVRSSGLILLRSKVGFGRSDIRQDGQILNDWLSGGWGVRGSS